MHDLKLALAFRPSGTGGEQIGRALDHYGVPYRIFRNTTFDILQHGLGTGHVFVLNCQAPSAGDYVTEYGLALWEKEDAFPVPPDLDRGHWLLCTGVDATDALHPDIILQDSDMAFPIGKRPRGIRRMPWNLFRGLFIDQDDSGTHPDQGFSLRIPIRPTTRSDIALRFLRSRGSHAPASLPVENEMKQSFKESP